MRNRYIVPGILAAAALSLGACSTSNPAQDSVQGSPELSTQQVNDQCGSIASKLSPWPGDLNDPAALDNGALMCGDLQRGRDFNDLYQPDSIGWNEQCLSRHGYSLSAYADGTPKLESNDPQRFTPQDVAECGTPRFTAEQCENVSRGLGAVDTGGRKGTVMGAEEAVVLSSLGCDVPSEQAQTGKPHQAGIAAARTAGEAGSTATS